MPPSQLKRLKASLREQGLTGQQKTKKQKKQQNGNADQRVQRQAALQGIRDSFNPFEIKAPSRPAKFETTSHRNINGKGKVTVERPGVTKSMGEEARKRSLLPEMQRRNKVGGVLDRRIGENDPSMTPEERALQRFQRQQLSKKGSSMFDLEDADEEGGLTHMGRALDLEGGATDDFDAGSIAGSDAGSEEDGRFLKRRRSSGAEGDGEVEEDTVPDGAEDEGPARKKSKKEVMEEVMAKSKLHKYERQKAKEEDDDLRAELDAGLGDMLQLLQGYKKPQAARPTAAPAANAGPQMNADRLALLNGTSRAQANKDYDARTRELAMDQRAAPADRTKTAEEKAADEAERLRKLEDARQRRMRGQDVEGENEEEDDGERRGDTKSRDKKDGGVDVGPEEEEMRDDAAEFGLSAPSERRKLPVLEDEDEFELDDDLIMNGSDVDVSGESDSDRSDESDGDEQDEEAIPKVREEEEDEFVRGILDENGQQGSAKSSALKKPESLAFTYDCPRSHDELLALIKDVPAKGIPTIIQRIRALYHPSLSASNKEKLADFAAALVDHISYMASHPQDLPVIEQIIRHLHSLSRTYPEHIANAFRTHLEALSERGYPTNGDMVILTAIGSIYSTSDHFHQVVTPAITLMARWLGMTKPTTPSQLATGSCLVSLCIQYQRLSKRYIPEAIRFTTKAVQVRPQPEASQIEPHLANLLAMAELWHSKSAFTDIFSPSLLKTLSQLNPTPKSTLHRLRILISQSRLSRRPLELHHHRAQPIRMSVPKFEESFNPDKHYDPDRERSDAAKLKKEYKRERKGAVRELRKDANFVARTQLREKRERDEAYEKKYKRLVAEIQGQEGKESKDYEREKRMRKGKR